MTIGLAVTREGMPVRCWVFPGNQSDANAVERVQTDLAGRSLGRVVWVLDRGMTSERNTSRILQRGGGHYILGEKSGNRPWPHCPRGRSGRRQPAG